ncbi:MAG: serine protein kinase, partial [Ethanoligenens sp.]
MDFSELLEEDRASRKKQNFEGTLLEYLHIVAQNPDIAKLAHKRMYDVIISKGVETIQPEENTRVKKLYGNEAVKRYNFFKEDFFGIDKTIMKIVNYFYSASMQGEESRQVLYLVGPVGSGKSSLVEALKQALEACDPIYALKGCPMREDPLHLIPKHLRPRFEELLGVKIEGDLCPVCRYRLKEEYHGEYEKFPVVTSDFSIRARKGVG